MFKLLWVERSHVCLTPKKILLEKLETRKMTGGPLKLYYVWHRHLKVHVLSRWLVGNACARRSSLLWMIVFRISSNEKVIVVSFLSVRANNIWELMRRCCSNTPLQHFWFQIKVYCNMLSSRVLVVARTFQPFASPAPNNLIVNV